MELKVAVQELAKALQRVQGIVEKKTTMPILANVLLEASENGRLTVSATNLEIGLSGSYGAEVKQAGSITLAGRALYEIVRSLPEETVSLKRAANNWVAPDPEVTLGWEDAGNVVGAVSEAVFFHALLQFIPWRRERFFVVLAAITAYLGVRPDMVTHADAADDGSDELHAVPFRGNKLDNAL